MFLLLEDFHCKKCTTEALKGIYQGRSTSPVNGHFS